MWRRSWRFDTIARSSYSYDDNSCSRNVWNSASFCSWKEASSWGSVMKYAVCVSLVEQDWHNCVRSLLTHYDRSRRIQILMIEEIYSVALCIWNRSGGPGRPPIRQWPQGREGTCLHVRKKSDVLVDSHAHQHLVAQSKQTLQYDRNYMTTNWNTVVTANDTDCAWACSLEKAFLSGFVMVTRLTAHAVRSSTVRVSH